MCIIIQIIIAILYIVIGKWKMSISNYVWHVKMPSNIVQDQVAINVIIIIPLLPLIWYNQGEKSREYFNGMEMNLPHGAIAVD